jgi:hypothetical protein
MVALARTLSVISTECGAMPPTSAARARKDSPHEIADRMIRRVRSDVWSNVSCRDEAAAIAWALSRPET